ncbi:site-specific DNA-methyltransferase, partial [Mycoplasma zalophidermidis]
MNKELILNDYINKINEISKHDINQDQKDLIINILKRTDEKDLQDVYQFLIKRVKIGFVFDEAPACKNTALALLKKDNEKSFINDMFNHQEFENTLIIGENYDALKNLLVIERERERERVASDTNAFYDVIYIDPPYNTESSLSDGNSLKNGEKDDIAASKFIYRDKFSRTGWLNMMSERLRMAKNLLKEDGVIFVSIDDTEQAYLKVLMDEIFGEENFGACLSRLTKKGGGRFGTSNIQKDNDYVLVYYKNVNKVYKFKKIESEWDDYKYEDWRGRYTLKHPLDGGGGNKSYVFGVNLNNKIFFPRNNKNWSFSEQRIKWMVKNDFIVENKKGILYVKNYKDWEIITSNNEYSIVNKFPGIDWSSSKLLDNKFSNSQGKADLNNVLNKGEFDYPKPINLIKQLINSCPNKNARILDFFAGSGTTGHAVMELNREDGGNRTFTLVTNNENNIAYDVTYERLYRINSGKGTKEESFKWLEKNKPYKQNLNVFNIEYFDTKLFDDNVNNELIKQTL